METTTKTTTDKITLRQWIAALRSGRYKQATGRLRKLACRSGTTAHDDPVGHCCLGVLADMVVRLDRGPTWLATEFACDGITDNGLLPATIVRYVSMPMAMLDPATGKCRLSDDVIWDTMLVPKVDPPTGMERNTTNVADLNDDGHVFHEIAQYVEDSFPEALDGAGTGEANLFALTFGQRQNGGHLKDYVVPIVAPSMERARASVVAVFGMNNWSALRPWKDDTLDHFPKGAITGYQLELRVPQGTFRGLTGQQIHQRIKVAQRSRW